MASLSLPSNPLMKTDTVGANLPIEVEYTQEDYEEALFRGRKLGHLKNSITKGKSNIWGMLGEKVVQKWVNGVLADTHDYDILSPEGIKLEVKTKKTTLRQPPKAHFECSVCNHNLKQKCDMYVFVRISTARNCKKAWICGCVPKDYFMENARKFNKGDTDPSNNYKVHASCHNMNIGDLFPLKKYEVSSNNSAIV